MQTMHPYIRSRAKEATTSDGGRCQEHNLFLKGLEKFGKDWRKISTIVFLESVLSD